MNRAALALALAAAFGCSSAPRSRPRVAPPPPAAPAPPAPPAAAPQAEAQPRPEVLVARARALRAEGDVAGAQGRLEAALLAVPDDAGARVELADLLVADGRELDRAAALLGGVDASAGPRVHLVSARLAESRGDADSAAAEYALALSGDDDPEVRLRRALVLERLGRPDEAIIELERVRAVRPADPVARAHLAERYEAAGRLEEAEAEYRWLADDQPDRAAQWERLAGFYERAGRRADARAALARARETVGRQERALRPLLPSKR